MKIVKFVLLLIGVVVFLGIASYFTTSMDWLGAFPEGECRLNIRNVDGARVKGAVLRLYRGETNEPAYKQPILNYVPDKELSSDENGRIVAYTGYSGKFGGHSWKLFWLIPMGDKGPEYNCELSAAGYKPAKFSIHQLWKTRNQFREDFHITKETFDNRELEFLVYENTFTLER
jgi:hypothetical protein